MPLPQPKPGTTQPKPQAAQPKPNPVYTLGRFLKAKGIQCSANIDTTWSIPYDANTAVLLTNYCIEVKAANPTYKLFKYKSGDYFARPENSNAAVFELFFTDKNIRLHFAHSEDAFCKAYAQKFTDYLAGKK
jgi:hypothetical protein